MYFNIETKDYNHCLLLPHDVFGNHCCVLMIKKYDKKHDPQIICIRLWLDHLTSLCLDTNVFKESPEFDGRMKSLSHKSQFPEVLFCSGSFCVCWKVTRTQQFGIPIVCFPKRSQEKLLGFHDPVPRSLAVLVFACLLVCLLACLLVCLFACLLVC